MCLLKDTIPVFEAPHSATETQQEWRDRVDGDPLEDTAHHVQLVARLLSVPVLPEVGVEEVGTAHFELGHVTDNNQDDE